MHCGTIGSCQSAATFEIVKHSCHESDSCKWRYSKCSGLHIFTISTVYELMIQITRYDLQLREKEIKKLTSE